MSSLYLVTLPNHLQCSRSSRRIKKKIRRMSCLPARIITFYSSQCKRYCKHPTILLIYIGQVWCLVINVDQTYADNLVCLSNFKVWSNVGRHFAQAVTEVFWKCALLFKDYFLARHLTIYTRNFNVKVSVGKGKAVTGVEDMYPENWWNILLLQRCRCLKGQMMVTAELCSNACYVFFASTKHPS